MKKLLWGFMVLVALTLSGCKKSDDSSSSTETKYALKGRVVFSEDLLKFLNVQVKYTLPNGTEKVVDLKGDLPTDGDFFASYQRLLDLAPNYISLWDKCQGAYIEETTTHKGVGTYQVIYTRTDFQPEADKKYNFIINEDLMYGAHPVTLNCDLTASIGIKPDKVENYLTRHFLGENPTYGNEKEFTFN